mmetsp:Transcript_29731/g.39537  ORF Transcript_29731/g.39537 Transcript_29731/m.39537 type:complete len:180 (+) Transcript_29731:3823-4362(+)
MLPERFLPLGYSFVVYFDLEADLKNNDGTFNPAAVAGKVQNSTYDTMFQSVSGLSVDIETEEYAEGGENSFKHTLPVRTKYPNLVLTRGLAPSSAVTRWIHDATENFQFSPADLTIILMGPAGIPVHAWQVRHAIPIKWSVGAFNAEESKIVIESLELKYNTFRVLNADDLSIDVKNIF